MTAAIDPKAFAKNPTVPPRIPAANLLWGWRLCSVDMTSSRGYRWPHPGHWAYPADHEGKKVTSGFSTKGACPEFQGDGICIAKTLQGATSGGARIGKSVGLVVAYIASDVLAADTTKLRVRRAWVSDTFDPVSTMVRAGGADLRSADLSGADLRSADLRSADLRSADLSGAYLRSADLRSAYLSGAYLSGAYLRSADLRSAYLSGADLRSADLSGADLRSADLSGAYLSGAYLRSADLSGADLSGADLSGADLRSAYLSGAYLSGARYTQLTLWSAGFNPAKSGAVKL